MQKLLALILGLCAGCAQISTTVTESEPAKDGQPARTTSVQVAYRGTSDGARNLLETEIRRKQSLQSGDVAKAAIAKGMPASLGQDSVRSDVQAGGWGGWGGNMAFGPGGAYSYGPNGAYMPGGNPANMSAAQLEMMGYSMYPQLGVAPVYQASPSQPQGAGAADGTVAACPKDRLPATAAERLSCNEQDIDEILRVLKPK